MRSSAAFSVHPQVRHAAAQVRVMHGELGELLTRQPVIEQRGKEGAIPPRFESVAHGEHKIDCAQLKGDAQEIRGP